ncbi:SOS response-associated peptidase [Candidatus Riflebacteria bacterium]
MCGRFSLICTSKILAELFDLLSVQNFTPRYNISPTESVASVGFFMQQQQRELSWLHWGLVPPWSKDRSFASRLINARCESLASKPSFKNAFRKRRCLIVADGFYEWKKEKGKKVPYYFKVNNDLPFAFAGLWESWQSPQNEKVDSCCIITTESNDLLKPIHHRMPVILDSENYQKWLAPDLTNATELKPLLAPFPSERMKCIRVNPYVNNARNKGEKCIMPEEPTLPF